ncbi:DUF6705 family protein [Flavobacterium pectinovorum]|uniref:DUF6705 domain-containing protein n=1 Tax=Flavobacterium pectinovorum TaxID=29533 RepID=A0A502F5P7_9FLAO|nr:DUF6705 family protein [Flavobacterium pectinovorum]TPG44359.1 hypothetical protein EAH81_02475 [Flavobacterium pectinovorum]
MKKIIILSLIIIANLSCKAQQIIPVEKAIDYRLAENGIPDNTYFKDINNLLDKFVGTWIGTYNNKTYKFKIDKFVNNYSGGTKEDVLLMRYIITNANGTQIENTTTLSDDNYLVIIGDYIQRSTYHLNYSGRESTCGQLGTIYIEVLKSSNNTKMKLFLLPDKIMISPSSCPQGVSQQIMPIDQIVLTKQ